MQSVTLKFTAKSDAPQIMGHFTHCFCTIFTNSFSGSLELFFFVFFCFFFSAHSYCCETWTTLCNFYPTVILGCMHKEFICFLGYFVSLLEQMDPQSRQLHPHTFEANRATRVVVSFARLPKYLEISHPSVYSSSRYLFYTWSKPVRVTNSSHNEI